MAWLNFIINCINWKDLMGVLYVSRIKDTNMLYRNMKILDHYYSCNMMTGHLPRPLDGAIKPVIFLLQEALLFESCVARQQNIRIKKCLSLVMFQFAESQTAFVV